MNIRSLAIVTGDPDFEQVLQATRFLEESGHPVELRGISHNLTDFEVRFPDEDEVCQSLEELSNFLESEKLIDLQTV